MFPRIWKFAQAWVAMILWASFTITVLVLQTAVSPAWAQAQPTPGNQKPNIVLVFMDNYGWGEPGVYGGGVLRGAPSPHIDHLAAEGMRLLNFNVEAQCTPSRAAIMTGRYAVRTGNPSVPISTPTYGLTQWEVTLPEMLSDRGYATGMFGKWHLGQTPGRYPTDQGFDEWYGIPNSSDESFWPGDTRFLPDSHPLVKPELIMAGRKGTEPQAVKVYDLEERPLMDRELTDKAIDFIERQVQASQPFFAFIPYTQTHMPTVPHPDFAGITGHGDYADVLVQIDTYVGELMAKVDELGIADDTLFIFTSDNGPDPQEPWHGFSGPWRGSYFTGYEGSLRVPFIARWPGKIPAGMVSDEIVHEMDLFPTLARLVGGKVPSDRVMDGIDQLDFFLGKQDHSNRESVIIYAGSELFGVKWRNFKLVFKEIASAWGQPTQTHGTPLFIDLYTDPKEEHPTEPNWIHLGWVRWPAGQVLAEHMASLQKEPPITPGTADPYRPGRR